MIKEAIILVGKSVRLEPLEIHHVPDLMKVALKNQDEFGHTFVPLSNEESDRYFVQALNLRHNHLAYPFVMLVDGRVIGTTRYTDIDWQNKTLGIGYTWFDKKYYGTAVNVESKYLLFKYAFEELGFMRIKIRVDSLNKRSRRAVKALGTTLEGIMRKHKITSNGRIRHTALYSILDDEWPDVKPMLQERIRKKAGANSKRK